MNRQEFLKAVKQYLRFFTPREENIESVIREKCGKTDSYISTIIDYAKWINNAVFRRPEISSDDVLEFLIGPCIIVNEQNICLFVSSPASRGKKQKEKNIFVYYNSAEFWPDINKTVFYNGYIAGRAGIIKTMYVSSEGKFYDHNHKLIAANEEDFFDYLLSVEFDFHPVIKECVYDALRKAGWYEGRYADIAELNDKYKEFNIFLSKAQLDF